MTAYVKIWHDLVDSKYGDEYLILYLKRQKAIRKWFKIFTIIFSASGIFSAFQSAKIPTIVSCSLIGIVQLFTSIENFIIHSEDDLDRLSKLRLLYYDRTNRLEKLFDDLIAKKKTDEEATDVFFDLRESSKEIEDLDNKLNIRNFKKLIIIADTNTRNYLKSYYYEQQ